MPDDGAGAGGGPAGAPAREIQTLVKGGTRPISDLYSQQAAVAAAQSAVVDAQNAVQLARLTLTQTLQLDLRDT